MSDITISDLSVFLIEPSSTQQQIISKYLKDFGITHISPYKSAHDALSDLANNEPDLVISAMHMQDMTGTELIQSMRENEAIMDVPFMLISSETSFRYLDPIRQAGVIAILPKPFQPEQLLAALRNTIDFILPDELSSDDYENEELEVLVVDDSSTARRHISRVLTNLGIKKITEATNGKEAVQIIDGQYFDLIVTDYNMPEMDGHELVEFIRTKSSQSSIPILMVSSESDESRLAAVQQVGVSAVCDKPFEMDNVRQILKQMLA
jgi:two-component system chemotaxis response regulator CheY